MVYLAFFWHQHQPYYRDPATGRATLPWVRLHATKDYYGMARLLSEFPEVRATFNFVPSLVEQLQRFASGETRDLWLDVIEPEARSLSDAGRQHVIDIGFHANPRTMIPSLPRYEALYRKKLVGARFATQEILDLQVLSVLAWFHQTLLDEDPVASALRAKGRDFTEEDKHRLLEAARRIAGSVLPLHRELEERGQIEITTSPYYHPILPLLCDFRSAFEALPQLAGNLGFEPISLREDARAQIASGIRLHQATFGRRPRGMWPPEGSVSEDVIPLVAEAGIRYIASDEEVLARSIGRPIRRDAEGHVVDGELLYRPWRAAAHGAEVSIVFRDRRLSDLIGFVYHRDGGEAVGDFLRRLAWIRDHSRVADPLVTVILDGENAWEHYPHGGVPFLRGLYSALAANRDWVSTVRIGDEIDRRPKADLLPRLFAGSWINHDFAIWIGHEEDRRAWRLLLDARRVLVEEERAGRLSTDQRAAAWEEIHIAEGSDWYWWYGDDRSSGMDEVFDGIFRERLRSVYRHIGRQPPPDLEAPIGRPHRPPVTQPTAFLRVEIDGRRTSFFEWLAAGRFRAQDEAGAMSRAQAGSLNEIAFGFDRQRLFLSLDFGERGTTIFHEGATVHLHFLQPNQRDLEILGPGRMRLDGLERSSVAVDEILEVAIPWEDLGAAPGQVVSFYAEVHRPGRLPERAPRGFAIEVEAPGDDFEARHWTA
jgi:alpha-amylase/alpha-mannosidase (GH57 family)